MFYFIVIYIISKGLTQFMVLFSRIKYFVRSPAYFNHHCVKTCVNPKGRNNRKYSLRSFYRQAIIKMDTTKQFSVLIMWRRVRCNCEHIRRPNVCCTRTWFITAMWFKILRLYAKYFAKLCSFDFYPAFVRFIWCLNK